MKITFDKEADAAYIYLADSGIEVSETVGDWPFHIDLGDNGRPVGIEIMDASKIFRKDYLERQIQL